MEQLLEIFTSTETPFMLLFVILFIWYVRENKKREEYYREQNENMRKIQRGELEQLDKDVKLMLQVWKTLLEKDIETERREKNDRYKQF